jgi:single-strand DNA-binding protein
MVTRIEKLSRFFDCSYWITDKIAQHLTKGSVVQLNGRVGMNVYSNMDGEAKGYLTYHVNSIKIVHKSQKGATDITPAILGNV